MAIQKTTSINSLIPATTEAGDEISRHLPVIQSPVAMKYLMKSFKAIGGDLNAKSIYLIENSCRQRNLSIEQIERGLHHAFEHCQYKPQWSDVLRGIKETQKGDRNPLRKIHD